MNPIFLPIICLVLPFIFQYAEAKFKWFASIGSVVWAYIFGIILGNLPWNQTVEPYVMPILSAAVPLSIPLLLFQADFKPWILHAKESVLSFFLGCSAVIISAISSAFLFEKSAIFPEVVAMLTGTFIGGSPNLNAIGLSTAAKPETLALANGLDVFWSGLLLFILTTFGIPFFRKILQKPSEIPEPFHTEEVLTEKLHWKHAVLSIALSALILVISLVFSRLIFNTEHLIFIFSFVTFAGILLSLNPKVRALKHAESIGNYLILVFCISIASLINIQTFMNQSFDYFWLGAWMVFGSMSIHLILAKLFKINSDTFIITCVATIYSPAFVGMMAKRMNNKSVVLQGFTAGIAGFAIGTSIGLFIYSFLKYF